MDESVVTEHADQGTVGFVGAGRIGEPMVERLCAGGHRVLLFARRPEVRARLSQLGAQPVAEAVQLAAADVVVSCLYSDRQILDVLPGIVSALRPGAVLVSHTTGSPATLERLGGQGIGIVDAPFSGSAEAVRAGRLTVYLGADDEYLPTARGIVGSYADPVIIAGGRGSALRVKLLNNLLFAAISQITLSGLAAGRKLGVTEKALLGALAVSSGGSAAARYIDAVGDSGRYVASVTPFLRKDIAACAEVAADLGVDLSALLAAASAGPLKIEAGGSGDRAADLEDQ
jgi:3-hydroxyisobutyrate dehydrogenase-like beta-hydroxyacid dehydrogenase